MIGVVEDLGESALSEIAQEIPTGHDLLDYDANEPPIIKLVNLLFSIAAKDRASDIHIQPYEKDLRVRFRIDGLLYDMYKPPKRAQEAIISRIKVMAGLDVAEKRMPQDGRIKIRVNEKEIDIRVSIIPSAYGEQVVMRLLDKGAAMVGLDKIGMNPPLKKLDDLDHNEAPGSLSCNGPHGKWKDYYPLCSTPAHQYSRKEHPDRRGPSGVRHTGVRTTPGKPEDRSRFCPGLTFLLATGPRRDHGRRGT